MRSATKPQAVPMGQASRSLNGDQSACDAQQRRVPVDLGRDRGSRDLQKNAVPADLDGDQPHSDAQERLVSVDLDGDHCRADAQCGSVAIELVALAETVSDLEQVRKALGNRIGAAERDYGACDPALLTLAANVQALEDAAVKALERKLREHPLGPWVKRTVGVGAKQGARLIAALGDPYWNALEDRPRRGPAELWAYCGYAPGQQRQRGVKSNWNAQAKTRAYLIAESCMKNRRSPYRPVYDASRVADADLETTDLHKHNRALRKVAKRVLKDLWLEAKALSDQPRSDAHTGTVAERELEVA